MDQLPTEIEFEIARIGGQIELMSRDQLIGFAKDLLRHMKVQEATYRELIAHQWGLSRIQLSELTHDDHHNAHSGSHGNFGSDRPGD